MGAVGDIYLSVVPVQLSCPTAAVAALYSWKKERSKVICPADTEYGKMKKTVQCMGHRLNS